ncbi:unnamed protein product [Penicillium crustosum]
MSAAQCTRLFTRNIPQVRRQRQLQSPRVTLVGTPTPSHNPTIDSEVLPYRLYELSLKKIRKEAHAAEPDLRHVIAGITMQKVVSSVVHDDLLHRVDMIETAKLPRRLPILPGADEPWEHEEITANKTSNPNAWDMESLDQALCEMERATPQTSFDLPNSETRVTSETTSAAQTTPMPEQPNCMHANSGPRSRVTVAPPVVESSAQSTTTTTVITITTTTVSKNVMETPNKTAEDAKTAPDGIQQAKDEDLESLSSGPESEQRSEIGAGMNQHPEFFGCLHCEKLCPWPMAGLHICLWCIRDWKWCAKGAHNQAKASFIWGGEEHNECYMCQFAGM